MAAMRNIHRYGVQSFLSKGVMTSAEVKEMYKSCCDKYEEPYIASDIKEYILTINRNIHPFSMEIRKGVEEDNGTHVYALVRTTESELGKLSTDYQQNELELYKKTIDLIVQSGVGVASSTDILNLTTTLDKNVKKMTKVEAQATLKKLIKDKWLTENQGEVSLSARAILELESLLREIYEDDISFCNMCKSIVLKGKCCLFCDVKLHNHCADRLFRGRASPVCPGCASPWQQTPSNVNMEEMNGEVDEQEPGPSRRRHRRR
ncbi:non-structural maintenance of chromosomes element 1 homolog [Ptychodera flava]|uniref:non-structural maintenance of chromosomes element 1 homolog n=1 Tax=Ptychodera flava TaxID=63121 RepID=UPI003969FE26